jgi:hypothetical protein
VAPLLQKGARQILQCVGQIKFGSSAQALYLQFSAAWKTQRHNAGLFKFANFQIAIFRRELDGLATAQRDATSRSLEGACNQCRYPPLEATDLSERILPI